MALDARISNIRCGAALGKALLKMNGNTSVGITGPGGQEPENPVLPAV